MKKYIFLLNTENLVEFERNKRYIEKVFPKEFLRAKFFASLEEVQNYLFIDSSMDGEIISKNTVYEIFIIDIPKDAKEIAKSNVHCTVNAHLHIYKKAD